jgi:hypothetical membrane protein
VALISINKTARQRYLRAAGWLWLSSGLIYLLCEAIASAAFEPNYSYARNYISDLGVPECGTMIEGRIICSPLHALMNVNFILHGLLFFTASACAVKALKRRRNKFLFLALAGVHFLGNATISIFHGAAASNVAARLHLTGAVLAITGGNLAIFTQTLTGEMNASSAIRTISKALPVLGFIGFTILVFAEMLHASVLLPIGIWERLSVDTIMMWEIAMGIWLISRTRFAQ